METSKEYDVSFQDFKPLLQNLLHISFLKKKTKISANQFLRMGTNPNKNDKIILNHS